MAANRPTAAVAKKTSSLDSAPRTTGTARVREVWDHRLRQSERDVILSIAGLGPSAADLPWSQLTGYQQRNILIALRDLTQLGNEASYALGYSRRNG